MKKGKYYKPIENNQEIQCLLCPAKCFIKHGKTGFCRVRKNNSGILEPLTYGKISGMSLDPIEKKPMYHFFPGKQILSVGSIGCNLKCVFCQNFDISQNFNFSYLREVSKEQLLELAVSNENNIGIAFTYNEPLIGYEFVLDTSVYFRENGLKNVIVSNGIINREPMLELVSYIDGANIDLKGIDDEFYKNNCRAGNADTVLQTIEILYKNKVTVEVTNLIVTGLNDSIEKIKILVDSVSSISKDIPLHFSKYFPRYEYLKPATNEKILLSAYEYGKTKLNYVYVGNANIDKTSNTYCPSCGKLLIERLGYSVKKMFNTVNCPECKTYIYGIE
ncbi:AmmeMemoRadiSam system radical SAM enzyme [Candidatus Dependentiae bacterium]|nr:AmmeMemoRadiSam system radical SAM enzyme [Candidatus Dependentiae bacterium]